MRISYPLGKNNSVFQAERVGITTAAIAMTNRKVMNNKIIINSDSQTVLRSLASSSTTSNLIYDCHNALETLAASNDITLRWVKGHDGNPGNEAADSLARQATTLKRERIRAIRPEVGSRITNKMENARAALIGVGTSRRAAFCKKPTKNWL
ncbi:jg17154 [Pararge aegeria aegeria]|uniref:Jg17154 protein n=1 Tax=Pararge aegeria aegeria TaxID=348720 RepID=A0A8S4RP25_9NEOP|nr:jg17154 [Pararge aegeria aegeria]